MISINFNGKNSYTDFGLILEERPAIPVTLQNYESVVIKGKSGSLVRRLGTYNDKIIVCKFALLSKNDFLANLDLVIAWLDNVTDPNLSLSYDTARYYKVKSVTCSENTQEMLNFYGRFEVTFTCEPTTYTV